VLSVTGDLQLSQAKTLAELVAAAVAKYARISERTAWRHIADTAVQLRIAALRGSW
jgi:hypothetical protein